MFSFLFFCRRETPNDSAYCQPRLKPGILVMKPKRIAIHYLRTGERIENIGMFACARMHIYTFDFVFL